MALLRAAGIAAESESAGVDEEPIKRRMRSEGASAATVALALAEAKARAVAARHPEALVVGADQMLVAGEVWFDKPLDLAAARGQLLALRGRAHRLLSAACAIENGTLVWSGTDAATLAMRPFSDAYLDQYLAAVGEKALHSVGAYQLEGLGAQLFERVEGDYFVILGLPLLALLDFLRRRGIAAS
jgi:septum formation protein